MPTAKTSEGVACASKWVAARTRSCIGVEASSTKLVVLLFLLRIGKELVCGLDLGKLVFRGRVFVRVGVVLLRQAVVRLLDLRGGGRLAYA